MDTMNNVATARGDLPAERTDAAQNRKQNK